MAVGFNSVGPTSIQAGGSMLSSFGCGAANADPFGTRHQRSLHPPGLPLDRLAGQLVGGRRGTTLSPHPAGADGKALPLYVILSLPQREAGEQA